MATVLITQWHIHRGGAGAGSRVFKIYRYFLKLCNGVLVSTPCYQMPTPTTSSVL